MQYNTAFFLDLENVCLVSVINIQSNAYTLYYSYSYVVYYCGI